MWVEQGHLEFNPSSLSKTLNVRIEKPMIIPSQTNREKYSGTSIARMRYRGPMESFKMNKSKADTYKDLFILRRKIENERLRFIQYIKDSIHGNSTVIKVSEVIDNTETIIFNDVENKQIEVMNHEITAIVKEAK